MTEHLYMNWENIFENDNNKIKNKALVKISELLNFEGKCHSTHA
jgi:hypothetical protein